MCIRDRKSFVVYYSVQPTSVFIEAIKGHAEPTILEKMTISVSYTHLRAHETVLDLVCRLLLEKKTLSNL